MKKRHQCTKEPEILHSSTCEEASETTVRFNCPACNDFMSGKIYICSNGHNFCNDCKTKNKKCPVCLVTILNQRNYYMETEAKKYKRLKKKMIQRNYEETHQLSPTRVLRSLGHYTKEQSPEVDDTLPLSTTCVYHQPTTSSAAPKRPRLSLDAIPKESPSKPEHIVCPLSNCCFFNNSLLKMKMHLQMWHSEKINQIESTCDQIMKVRVSWPKINTDSLHIFSSNDTIFLVYVRMKMCSSAPSFYINLVVIGNKNKVFKYSCSDKCNMCDFYHSGVKACEGLLVNHDDLDEYSTDFYTVTILIGEAVDVSDPEVVLQKDTSLRRPRRSFREEATLPLEDTFVLPNEDTILLPACSRRPRISLEAVPTQNKPLSDHIVCPMPNCCYSTDSLLKTKIHLHSWHPEKIYKVKKTCEDQCEKLMSVRIHWSKINTESLHLVASTETIFIVFVRTKTCAPSVEYYVNVAVVGNKNTIFKFTCGSKTKFCNFYRSGTKACEGLVVGREDLEEFVEGFCAAKLLITEVASIWDPEVKINLNEGAVFDLK